MLTTLYKRKYVKFVYFFNKIYAGSLELILAFSLVILLPTVIWILDLNSFATDTVYLPQCQTFATNVNICNNFQENIAHLNPFETISRYIFAFLVFLNNQGIDSGWKNWKNATFSYCPCWKGWNFFFFFLLLSIFIDHLNMKYSIYKMN